MKQILPALIALAPFTSFARNEIDVTDTTATTLEEVVATADPQIETAKKVILTPTKLEKRHSTNGYQLLENMNLPDFAVNPSAQSIATIGGRTVVVLINGVEAQPDELATLAASEIVQIDYRRNPGGKYVGNGALLNFITTQYDYGGNFYLSADEGYARLYGDYSAMANYKKKAVTLSVTANGKWDHSSTLNAADNLFVLNDGTMTQNVSPLSGSTHSNSQFINLKFAHAADKHTFDIAVSLTRSATPKNMFESRAIYSGYYNESTTALRQSSENALSPAIKMHYYLYLPGGHTIMTNVATRFTHTNFISNYFENGFDPLSNNTLENSVLLALTFGYFKSFSSGLNLGITLDEYYNHYHDSYSGSFNSRQTLANNHAMAMAHVDHYLPWGLSYYVSAGITDLHSTIGSHRDNYFSPMAFYGLTYNINRRHTLSVNGNYAHSIYNPAYKNEAVVHTSFFEATIGNPDLEQLKAFQNLVSYNGRFAAFGISFTYDFLKYFGNTSNRYFAANNIMYRQLVNDGTFHYNKIIIGASANLLDNHLLLNGYTIFSANSFNSLYRPMKSNDWRADFSVSYMQGDWKFKGTYALPYSVLDIEGEKVHNPAQYGLQISWQRGHWAAACSVENFLHRGIATRTVADYLVYQSDSRSLSDLKGRNISLSVTYILPYGKKTDKESLQTESAINSAILRPF